MITGSFDWRQDAVVDLDVIVGGLGDAGKGSRRHEDDASAHRLDGGELLLIGADDVVDAARSFGCEMIRAGTGKHEGIAPRLGGADRAADQFERGRPVEAHAALRGVHGFRDAEAEIPQALAIGDGLVPVDGGLQPRIRIGERIGHHVGGRERDAVHRPAHLVGEGLWGGELIGLHAAIRLRQADRQGADGFRPVHAASPSRRPHSAAARRPSGARASSRERIPRAERPSRLRRGCSGRAHPRRRDGRTSPTAS